MKMYIYVCMHAVSGLILVQSELYRVVFVTLIYVYPSPVVNI